MNALLVLVACDWYVFRTTLTDIPTLYLQTYSPPAYGKICLVIMLVTK